MNGNKKRFFKLLFFWILLLVLPVSAYFVTGEQDFDKRTEAAAFNSLVAEMEELIEEAPDHVPGVLRLEFPEGLSDNTIEEIIGRPRSTPPALLDTPFERVEYIEVDEANLAWEMAKYERYLPIDSVDLNYIPHLFWSANGANRAVPKDWNNINHWYFNKVKLPEAWKLQGCLENSTTCGGSKDIVVAIIDTGLAFSASEVQGMNIFSGEGYNKLKHADSGAGAGHGTYVAGVIASATNNNASSPVGIAHNVTILPLKTSFGTFSGNADIATEEAIYYAAKYADVINMSFGYGSKATACAPSSFQPLKGALEYAFKQGVVLVAASGNTGENCMSYPASDPKVLAVGAVNANNSRSTYSQYGNGLDFVAPVGQTSKQGGATWQQTFSCAGQKGGCKSNSNFKQFSNLYLAGTSFAAPQVAGAAALILTLDSTLSPAQVKEVLQETVTPIGSQNLFGHGLLNLENIYKHFDVVEPPSVALDLTFSVSPANISKGATSTLTWSSTGADRCEASGGWSDTKNLNGSESVTPVLTTKYTLACFKGVTKVEKEVTVVVEDFGFVFLATPTSIDQDESALLTWIADGFNSCTASGGWSGEKSLQGSQEVFPLETTSYILSCTKGGVEESQSVEVFVKECSQTSDCQGEYMNEMCFVDKGVCLVGDVDGDGKIDSDDFKKFKADYFSYKKEGWSESLSASDFLSNKKVTMADYTAFVKSYRIVVGLD